MQVRRLLTTINQKNEVKGGIEPPSGVLPTPTLPLGHLTEKISCPSDLQAYQAQRKIKIFSLPNQ